MVLRQVERLRQSRLIDELVIATSVDASDDDLVHVLEDEEVAVRRGSLEDVASRFSVVIEEWKPTTIVRLTADCPLADPEVIDRVIEEHLNAGADYTSNVIERTYPRGLDVECLGAETFATLMGLALTSAEREHVTLGIYNRPETFVLHSVTQRPNLSHLRWTVDLPEDLEFVRAVYDALYDNNPRFGQAEVLALLDREPGLVLLDF
jgi:spore coat polysaccharide biosynthesis protein SpsF